MQVISHLRSPRLKKQLIDIYFIDVFTSSGYFISDIPAPVLPHFFFIIAENDMGKRCHGKIITFAQYFWLIRAIVDTGTMDRSFFILKLKCVL